MPPKKTDNPTPKRKSRVAEKAKAELAKVKSRYSAKMREHRESRVPNALINSATAMGGGIPTALVRGLVPEEWSVNMGGQERQIPTGIVYDALAATGGILTTVAGAFAGSESVIHLGGGVSLIGVGGLVERGADPPHAAGEVDVLPLLLEAMVESR